MGVVRITETVTRPACAGAGCAARRALVVLALGLVRPFGDAGDARAGDLAEGPNYARVRHVEGAMTVSRSGRGGADEAGLNRPIAPGARLESLAGRAEIELADTSLIRVDRGSVVEFRTLADHRNRYERTNLLGLRRGRLRIDTPDPEQADAVFQIDTEAGSIYLLSAGSFRIEADVGVTSLASFGGVAEFSGDGGSVLVRSGQSSLVPIGGAPTAPRRFNIARRDDFDRYHDMRSTAYDDAGEPGGAMDGVPAGIPDDVAAYAPELSSYGTWHVLPTYGVVWRPHSAAGWSPFVHGSWGWYPAGWVWISMEPWGWAPYRYGRWDYTSALGWFWIPGTAWSGAWVGFAVGPRQIGWCPLNYWNRPVFRDAWRGAPVTVTGARLDPRGWWFVPIDRFGSPAAASPPARGQRPPANTTFVITRTLPRFDPVTIARRPDGTSSLPEVVRRTRVPLPAPRPGEKGVPFRVEEARTRQAENPGGAASRGSRRTRAGDAHTAAPSRPPREAGSRVVAAPAPVPPSPPPSQGRDKRPGHAVERLVDGARPVPPGRGPAPATGAPAVGTTSPGRKPAPKAAPARPTQDDPRQPEKPGTPER
jgi:hypothetical protein